MVSNGSPKCISFSWLFWELYVPPHCSLCTAPLLSCVWSLIPQLCMYPLIVQLYVATHCSALPHWSAVCAPLLSSLFCYVCTPSCPAVCTPHCYAMCYPRLPICVCTHSLPSYVPPHYSELCVCTPSLFCYVFMPSCSAVCAPYPSLLCYVCIYPLITQLCVHPLIALLCSDVC